MVSILISAGGELDALGDVLNQEGFFGGNADDIHARKPAVCAPDALTGQPQPSAGARVAVIHDKPSLFILYLGVVGGDTLVAQPNVRVLCLSDANCIVVLENGAVRWLIVRFFELKLDDALVDIVLDYKYLELNLVGELY